MFGSGGGGGTKREEGDASSVVQKVDLRWESGKGKIGGW